MDAAELHAILARGEDSRHQFKRDFSNVDSLAAELAALANGSGGQILIGVADDGQPWGLTPHDIGRINQLLSNAANQHLRPAHLPDTLTLTPAQIRAGQSNRRNKVLAEHAAHILPYRGLGTGTPRALQAWSKIDLIDEREANQFRAILWRSSSEQVIANSSEQVSVRASEQVPAKGSEQAPESQPESQPESRTESRPESASLENRVLQTLASKPAIKLEIAAQLGQKAVSGQLNKVIRALLAAQAIKYILPDKPNSRLQKYRRTALGQALTCFEASAAAAKVQGQFLFADMFDAHCTQIKQERERALHAYEARQQAMARIGLPAVRAHRRKRLDAEHQARLAALDDADASVPELFAVLMLRVGAV